MIRLWSWLCTVLGSLLAGALILMLVLPPLRSLPGEILIKRERADEEAEVMLFLMGDALDRVPYAARRLKEGKAQYILIVEAEQDELVRSGIKKPEGQVVYEYLTEVYKVPPAKIIFDRSTAVSSTFEEAEALLRLARERGFQKKRLVTSWYHSSRALWIFHKLMNKDKEREGKGEVPIDLICDPSPMPETWYKKELTFLFVFNEYLKWAYYYVRYDLLD